ncbi:MAG: HAMP domain-containing methyl-accepting chemotaxis protein [Pseudomonadota bacterium]
MSRLRIKPRVHASFGVLVLLGVGVAAFGVWKLAEVGGQVDTLVGVSGDTGRSLEVSERLEVMHRIALRVRSSADAAAAGEFNDAAGEAIELVKAAAEHAGDAAHRRTYTAIDQGIDAFGKQFDKLSALAKSIQDDRATLFKVGDALALATRKLIESVRNSDDAEVPPLSHDLDAALLLVQVANWRFLATADAQGAETFKANVEKAEKIGAELESAMTDIMERAQLTPVRSGLSAYKEAFAKLAGTMLESNDLFEKVMRPQIADLVAADNQAKAALQAELGATKATTDRLISSTTLTQEALVVVLLALSVVLAWWVGRSIAGPVVAMTMAMRKLADGDKSVEIPARDAQDEVGEMAQAVDVFKENMIKADALAAEQRAEQQRKEQRQAAIETLIGSFDRSVRELLDLLGSASTELQATAQGMSATADETSRQSTTVAAASAEASANVQTIAAATEELSASVAEIATQVSKSSTIAARAVDDAERSNKTIEELSQAAHRIGDVVKLITDIASQTNLLALNATIEAARAGDAGKGFAVVASEVKSLANQTSQATGDIAAQIDAIQAATEQAVAAIRSVTSTIAQMNEISAAIATAMEQQGSTTSEITRNAQEAARGTNAVSSSIGNVTRAAGEAGAASAQVLASAGELGKQSETLRTKVGSFLGDIRAA